MKRISVTAESLFLLLSIVSYYFSEKLASLAFGFLGLGLLLSDLAYLPTQAVYPLRPSTLPTWRRYASSVLVILAMCLFGYQIARDSTKSVPSAASSH